RQLFSPVFGWQQARNAARGRRPLSQAARPRRGRQSRQREVAMPDRLGSLIILVGAWVPPAAIGWAAAEIVRKRPAPPRPVALYGVLAVLVVGWAAAWFWFSRSAIPPYIPGATRDPSYAPPEVVRGLRVFTGAVILP